jgi:hypothetical protein
MTNRRATNLCQLGVYTDQFGIGPGCLWQWRTKSTEAAKRAEKNKVRRCRLRATLLAMLNYNFVSLMSKGRFAFSALGT